MPIYQIYTPALNLADDASEKIYSEISKCITKSHVTHMGSRESEVVCIFHPSCPIYRGHDKDERHCRIIATVARGRPASNKKRNMSAILQGIQAIPGLSQEQWTLAITLVECDVHDAARMVPSDATEEDQAWANQAPVITLE